MFTARISKAMMIGVVLSLLALLVAWPVSGQGPSGLSGFGTALEREQLEMVADESEVPAPSVLPVTGSGGVILSGFGTALEREQLEAIDEDSAAPTDLPATGSGQLWSGFGEGGLLNQQEILASQLAISGFSFEASAPSALPVTGSSQAILSGLGADGQYDQREILVNQLRASGIELGTGGPAVLPATGQRSNPYLELMEQYRHMYGGF